jgi:acyl-CoA thioesterase II
VNSGSPNSSITMAELLDLEELDRDLYRAITEYSAGERPNLYGGQVAAQALRAASLTVPSGRHPHSLHGYFLRSGRRGRPIIFKVERDRDGRSFSARRVVAVQDGEVIFDMTASFHVDESSGTFFPPMRQGLAEPGATIPERLSATVPSAVVSPIPPVRANRFGDPTSNRFWVRTRDNLGDDRLLHACALTYLSDIGSGFAMVDVADLPLGGPSLDHAVWFQAPIRTDDWCLLDLTPMMAGGARGLYSGTIHSADGILGAMITQQILLRPDRTQ